MSIGGMYIQTPIVRKGQAIVIMNATAKRGVWKLKGQQLSLSDAEEFTADLPEDNIFLY